MATYSFARWLAPVMLAAGLGIAALIPAPAKASDDLVRVLVDVADVIYHSGQPYYRHGHGYGYADRVIVVRDRYHRPTYYRYAPRTVVYHTVPRGPAYGYYAYPPPRPVQVRYVDRGGRYDRYDRHDRYDRDDRHGHRDHGKHKGRRYDRD